MSLVRRLLRIVLGPEFRITNPNAGSDDAGMAAWLHEQGVRMMISEQTAARCIALAQRDFDHVGPSRNLSGRKSTGWGLTLALCICIAALVVFAL